MRYVRMPIEQESPEQLGYASIRYNLSESSVSDRHVGDLCSDLDDILLCYGDHMGDIRLRKAVAGTGPGLEPDNVLITAGAASALFVIATSLLSEGDHIVVVRPNYATNIETPKAIGCDITYIEFSFENGFRLDLAVLASAIRPETKYVSITYPHNPSGVMLSDAELHAVVELVEARGCRLLFDETYREMTFGPMLPVAATLSPAVISVSSLSKSYGIPGIRIGWLISRDRELMDLFLSAKEQIGISGSTVDEHLGYMALMQRDTWLPENNARIKTAFDIVKSWIDSEELVEWVEPSGGCVCLPRITPDVPVDPGKFHRILYQDYSTYVGAGRWFEMPDNYFRVGYAWPTTDELSLGLENISKAIRAAVST